MALLSVMMLVTVVSTWVGKMVSMRTERIVSTEMKIGATRTVSIIVVVDLDVLVGVADVVIEMKRIVVTEMVLVGFMVVTVLRCHVHLEIDRAANPN